MTQLITENVQLWQRGVMMGLIPLKEANDLINEGTYRIITTQAIEWIDMR